MKDIPGYEGLYAATEDGCIFSYRSGRFLTQQSHHCGYLTLIIYDLNSQKKKWFVHRLVAFTFIPNPENLREVNHIDGNKKNNNVPNLEWVTASENTKHSYRIGLHKRRASPQRSLTNEQVTELRKLKDTGYSLNRLASVFFISKKAVLNIVKGRTYKEVS